MKNLTSTVQDIEERLSGITDWVKEMDCSVKQMLCLKAPRYSNILFVF